jgi:hypothetical protein
MNDALFLALAIVALILGIIEEVNAHGRSLIAWAVIALALIPILGRLL